MKHIEIEFSGTGDVFPVKLDWGNAPKTAEIVWQMLENPLRTSSNHAVFSGYEFFLYCNAVPLDLENHIVYPKPGQLLYYYLPAGRNGDNIAHKINLEGHKSDAAEIAIWYGEGDLRRMTECGVRGNLFGTVNGDLDSFFSNGHKTLIEGNKEIILRRSGER